MPSKPEGPSRTKVRQMTAKGLKPRAIAEAMGISTQAVHKHLQAIRKRDGQR